MTHTLVSVRTLDNVVEKMSRLPQDKTSEFFAEALARRLIRPMFRRTFESPTIEKHKDAIVNEMDVVTEVGDGNDSHMPRYYSVNIN
jgi:predicted 2-oxoglutarate/Fe(II)-dependent dioxygenase YbiX